ncbi:hypothetical protein Osc1_00620 [Hominimerdicola sp. 21CYCFAH17_S]
MNIKKAAAVILSVTIALGMVSCKGDKEESSKSESKSNNGNVNTESVSESSSTSANEESIADSVESSSGSQEESLGDVSDLDDEYLIQNNYSGAWQYERNTIFGSEFVSPSVGLGAVRYEDSNFKMLFFELVGIHDYYEDISFDKDNSSDWVNNCYTPFIEILDRTSQYRLDDSENTIVFKNQEEVKINGVKFIKFDGYFTDSDIGKVNIAGYITVYQKDGVEIYDDPDVIGFMTTLKDGEEGQEKLDEYSRHAAETLTFTE